MDPRNYLSDEDIQKAGRASAPKRPIINSEGNKVLLPLKAMHKEINGNITLEVTSVCIEDLVEGSSHEGAIHSETFYLNDRALWKLSKWCLAMGWLQEFDENDLDSVEQVFKNGPFVGVFRHSTYNDRDIYQIKYFNKYWVDKDADGLPIFTAEQKAIIQDAEEHLESYFFRRAENGVQYVGLETPNSSKHINYDVAPF